jgi:hypothetical protein
MNADVEYTERNKKTMPLYDMMKEKECGSKEAMG